jgi:ABC-type multidrug transport system ATPase subunit
MSIKIENLEIKFKDNSHGDFLKITQLNISPGDSVILMGANGSGKTTFINFLYGITSNIIFKGCCEVLGVKLNNISINEIAYLRKKIIYNKQHDSYSDFGKILVKDYLSSLLSNNQNKDYSVDSLLESFNTKYSKYTNYKIFKNNKLSSLSGGQSRLFKIYVSLLVNNYVELIILDEPINHLDIIGIKLLNNLLLEYKSSKPSVIIIIITHFKVFTFIDKLFTLSLYSLNEEKVKVFTEKDIGIFGSKINDKGYFLL